MYLFSFRVVARRSTLFFFVSSGYLRWLVSESKNTLSIANFHIKLFLCISWRLTVSTLYRVSSTASHNCLLTKSRFKLVIDPDVVLWNKLTLYKFSALVLVASAWKPQTSLYRPTQASSQTRHEAFDGDNGVPTRNVQQLHHLNVR